MTALKRLTGRVSLLFPIRTLWKFLFVLLLMIVCGRTKAFQISGTLSANSTSGPITAAGVVLNAINGTPIARALVRLNDRAMLTDREGKFEFDQFELTPTIVLQVRKPGFYSSAEMGMSFTPLQRSQLAKPIAVRLYPEALMTGTFTGADGTPLPQISVTAVKRVYNNTGYQWLPTGNSLTNSRGEFRLAVPAGDYRLETNFSPRMRNSSNAILPLIVPTPGPSRDLDSIHLRSGTEEKFELHPVIGRTYKVGIRFDPLQERGFPMIMARSSDGSTFPVGMARNGGSSSLGEIQAALPSGTFTLIANLNRGEDSEYGETTVTVTDQDLPGVILHLSPITPIPVQVVVDPESTSDKTPPNPRQLGLVLQNIQSSSRMMATSFTLMPGKDQENSIRATPGVYRFRARNSGQWYIKSATYGTADLLLQDMTVTTSAGNAPLIVTISNQTGDLQGTTKQDGIPSSSWIDVIPTGTSAVPFYTARSSADGTFSLSNLPPGSYQVISFESGHSADYHDPKTLAPFTTYIRSVTITRGNKATVDLDIVPDTEFKL